MRNSGEGKKKSRRDVVRHELIGLEVAVTSPHAGWNGLSGRIVDETKHTLLVETDPPGPREVLVPKKGQTFALRVENGCIVVQGDDIAFQPEDRTKRL